MTIDNGKFWVALWWLTDIQNRRLELSKSDVDNYFPINSDNHTKLINLMKNGSIISHSRGRIIITKINKDIIERIEKTI